MDWSRRQLLLTAAQLAAFPALARAAGATYPFSLGVASGSPLPNAVVLWTRVLANPLDAASTPPVALQLRWEVAHDEAFSRIAAKGTATALPALAHSVHVDAKGLQPGRWYWYRFMLGDAVSPIGRTRTAPAASEMPAMLKLAVASCQHWEFGSYAAHRHIAASAPDLVAFVGDYIYEWGPYRLAHPAKAVRTDESLTLENYRARYAQYKSDRDLQAAHHAAPWIVTWDDHEVANDYTSDVDPRNSAGFLARRAAAYQAFYEHMPIRLPERADYAKYRIFQRFDWGQLARFHVLDDRQYRAHHACNLGSASRRDCAELTDPGRSMLGGEQEAWLEQGLKTSKARWSIIAQQTLMAQSGRERVWTLGWLSGGAHPPVRNAGQFAGGQSAGGVGRRAQLFCIRTAARFRPPRLERQPGAGRGILRHLGHLIEPGAGTHPENGRCEPAHPLRAQRQTWFHFDGGDAHRRQRQLHGPR